MMVGAEIVLGCALLHGSLLSIFPTGCIKLSSHLSARLRRRKALLALSCLARNHGPALDAFRAEGGLRSLVSSASDDADPRQQRCAAAKLGQPVLMRWGCSADEEALSCALPLPEMLPEGAGATRPSHAYFWTKPVPQSVDAL